MIKKAMVNWLAVCLAFQLVMGCQGVGAAPLDGQVAGLQARTAMWVIEGARSGAPLAEMWVWQDGLGRMVYLFARPVGGGWGFVAWDPGASRLTMEEFVRLTGGNLVNGRTMAELMAALKASGWVKSSPQALGQVWSTAMQLAEFGSQALLSFLVLPIFPGMLPEDSEGDWDL